MKKKIAAVLFGLVAGGGTVALVEGISSVLYPPPPGMNFHDPDAMKSFVATLPAGAFLLVLLAHACGAFVAGLVCSWFLRRRFVRGGVLLGSLFLMAGVANLLTIPHPVWFAVIDILVYLPCALAGTFVWNRESAAATSETPPQNSDANS
ncbi:MAG: hypothetical protein KDA80_06040 [Planctomycetaceae bacterium]|nr:hypothetical protein [Planctomycetaceae bacterium]